MLSGAQTSGVRGGRDLFDSLTPAQWTVYSNAAQEFEELLGKPGFFTDELGSRLLDEFVQVYGGQPSVFPFALDYIVRQSVNVFRPWPSDADQFVTEFTGYMRGTRDFRNREGSEILNRYIAPRGSFQGLLDMEDTDWTRRRIRLGGHLLNDHLFGMEMANYIWDLNSRRFTPTADEVYNDAMLELGEMLFMDMPPYASGMRWATDNGERLARMLHVERFEDKFNWSNIAMAIDTLIEKLEISSAEKQRFYALHALWESGQFELVEAFEATETSYLMDGTLKWVLLDIAASQDDFTPGRVAVIKQALHLINFIKDGVVAGTRTDDRPREEKEFHNLVMLAIVYLAQSRVDAAVDTKVATMLEDVSQAMTARKLGDWWRNQDSVSVFRRSVTRASGQISAARQDILAVLKTPGMSRWAQNPSGSAPSTPAAPAAGGAAPSGAAGASSASASTAAPLWESVEITYADDSPITYAADDEAVEEWQAEEWIADESVPEDDASLAELGWAVFSGEAVGMGVALPF